MWEKVERGAGVKDRSHYNDRAPIFSMKNVGSRKRQRPWRGPVRSGKPVQSSLPKSSKELDSGEQDPSDGGKDVSGSLVASQETNLEERPSLQWKSGVKIIPAHIKASMELHLFQDGFILKSAKCRLSEGNARPYSRAFRSFFQMLDMGLIPGGLLDLVPCIFYKGGIVVDVCDYRLIGTGCPMSLSDLKEEMRTQDWQSSDFKPARSIEAPESGKPEFYRILAREPSDQALKSISTTLASLGLSPDSSFGSDGEPIGLISSFSAQKLNEYLGVSLTSEEGANNGPVLEGGLLDHSKSCDSAVKAKKRMDDVMHEVFGHILLQLVPEESLELEPGRARTRRSFKGISRKFSSQVLSKAVHSKISYGVFEEMAVEARKRNEVRRVEMARKNAIDAAYKKIEDAKRKAEELKRAEEEKKKAKLLEEARSAEEARKLSAASALKSANQSNTSMGLQNGHAGSLDSLLQGNHQDFEDHIQPSMASADDSLASLLEEDSLDGTSSGFDKKDKQDYEAGNSWLLAATKVQKSFRQIAQANLHHIGSVQPAPPDARRLTADRLAAQLERVLYPSEIAARANRRRQAQMQSKAALAQATMGWATSGSDGGALGSLAAGKRSAMKHGDGSATLPFSHHPRGRSSLRGRETSLSSRLGNGARSGLAAAHYGQAPAALPTSNSSSSQRLSDRAAAEHLAGKVGPVSQTGGLASMRPTSLSSAMARGASSAIAATASQGSQPGLSALSGPRPEISSGAPLSPFSAAAAKSALAADGHAPFAGSMSSLRGSVISPSYASGGMPVSGSMNRSAAYAAATSGMAPVSSAGYHAGMATSSPLASTRSAFGFSPSGHRGSFSSPGIPHSAMLSPSSLQSQYSPASLSSPMALGGPQNTPSRLSVGSAGQLPLSPSFLDGPIPMTMSPRTSGSLPAAPTPSQGQRQSFNNTTYI